MKKKPLIAGIICILVSIVLFICGMKPLDWNFEKLDYAKWEKKQYSLAVDGKCDAVKKIDMLEVDVYNAEVEVKKVSGNFRIEYEDSDRVEFEIECVGKDGKYSVSIKEKRKSTVTMFELRSPKIAVYLPDIDDVKISSSNGKVKICGGEYDDITLTQNNGDIELVDVDFSGEIKLRNDNGKITLTDVVSDSKDAAIYMTVGNGKIDGSGVLASLFSAETNNGAISVAFVGKTSDYSFDCNAVNGSSNFGKTSGGKRRIKCSTLNGNIELSFDKGYGSDSHDTK